MFLKELKSTAEEEHDKEHKKFFFEFLKVELEKLIA